jgi:hypothetical protein
MPLSYYIKPSKPSYLTHASILKDLLISYSTMAFTIEKDGSGKFCGCSLSPGEECGFWRRTGRVPPSLPLPLQERGLAAD